MLFILQNSQMKFSNRIMVRITIHKPVYTSISPKITVIKLKKTLLGTYAMS